MSAENSLKREMYREHGPPRPNMGVHAVVYGVLHAPVAVGAACGYVIGEAIGDNIVGFSVKAADAVVAGLYVAGTHYVYGSIVYQELVSRRELRRSIYQNTQHIIEHSDDLSEARGLMDQVSYLPPGGAKLIESGTSTGGDHVRFEPSILHELIAPRIADRASRLPSTRTAPDSPITVQLTTAGQHSDHFKLAALTMAAGHPYSEDWEKPFFEADWGHLGPMIHDGGGINHCVNNRWQVPGRTDYLMRLPNRFNDPEQSELLTRYVASRARFYQRASFAARCSDELLNIRYPHPDRPKIQHPIFPSDMRFKGAQIWEDFHSFTERNLFKPAGLENILDTAWIGEPRTAGGYPDRLEAEYGPIRDTLIRIEEAKVTHGTEVIARATACMDYLADEVDTLLDLPFRSNTEYI